jgi:phosphotransferase system enzyme I (PtsI)
MDRALVGLSASPGIVLGPVHLLRWEVPDVPHHIIADEDVEQEIARFHDAVERAKERLHQVQERARRHAGPEEAAIFEVQISILEDSELVYRVESYVRQNLCAEKAFDLVLLEWRQQFARCR